MKYGEVGQEAWVRTKPYSCLPSPPHQRRESGVSLRSCHRRLLAPLTNRTATPLPSPALPCPPLPSPKAFSPPGTPHPPSSISPSPLPSPKAFPPSERLTHPSACPPPPCLPTLVHLKPQSNWPTARHAPPFPPPLLPPSPHPVTPHAPEPIVQLAHHQVSLALHISREHLLHLLSLGLMIHGEDGRQGEVGGRAQGR